MSFGSAESVTDSSMPASLFSHFSIREGEHGFSRFGHGVLLSFDLYIWEPICTGFRFLHFVVFILTVPARPGPRDPNRGQ